MRIGMQFDRGNRSARLADELREHRGRQIDENLAAGMNREDARSEDARSEDALGGIACLRQPGLDP